MIIYPKLSSNIIGVEGIFLTLLTSLLLTVVRKWHSIMPHIEDRDAPFFFLDPQ